MAAYAFDSKSKDEPDLRSESECFPEIDPGLDVAGDRVLVQLRREKSTSKGGIILVDETRQTLRFNETVAKVIQIGPLAYKSPEDLTPWIEGPWCKEGDLVRTIKYGGDRFVVQPDDEGSPVVFITLQAREIISRIKSFEYAQKMKSFVD
jgi:co-chaperonin GroES (HSP10)